MPSPTLVMVPRPDLSPPEVTLTLTWAGQTSVPVERLDPDGQWRPVREGEPATLTQGSWTGHDVEAASWELLSYRAKVGTTVVTGLTPDVPTMSGGFDSAGFDATPSTSGHGFASGYDTAGFDAAPSTAGFDTSLPVPGAPASNRVILKVPDPWLIHPGSPSLSQKITVRTVTPRIRKIPQTSFPVQGRTNPVVVSQRRTAPSYDMTVLTETAADSLALTALLASGSTLFWNIPANLGLSLPTGWVSVGDVQDEHLIAGFAGDPRLVWTLPLQVVDRPAGGQAQAWSWATLIAEQPTWADAVAHYTTWADLLAHSLHA